MPNLAAFGSQAVLAANNTYECMCMDARRICQICLSICLPNTARTHTHTVRKASGRRHGALSNTCLLSRKASHEAAHGFHPRQRNRKSLGEKGNVLKYSQEHGSALSQDNRGIASRGHTTRHVNTFTGRGAPPTTAKDCNFGCGFSQFSQQNDPMVGLVGSLASDA